MRREAICSMVTPGRVASSAAQIGSRPRVVTAKILFTGAMIHPLEVSLQKLFGGVLFFFSHKLLILHGQFDSKPLAKCPDVVIIVLVQWIAGMKFHQPCRRYAFYSVPVD